MSAVLRTPDLARALADYTGRLGFECLQHVPGALALLRHGPLQLQLWACAAPPGRFERLRASDLPAARFAPAQQSVVVHRIETLYTSLRAALKAAGMDPLARLSVGGPMLRPWGAREFELRDLHGNRIHCVDWGVCAHDPAQLARFDLLDGDLPEDGG
ncbi:hypothetical protein [Hydrogenophaga pseudoflava]|uniref:hypothetical protein n=1 Tax=Hydrogenophaga pseudoflava TaxID=47421 RepID=UPI0027E435B2|nr:hypothetical protein [Hydrogenophaga pseudoflava]MDQ7746956.1 hypothetical protein [Hydrogenophaga pseudoflava]